MYRQISMFKIKADAPPRKIDEIEEELRNLGRTVPEVKRARVARTPDSPLWDLLFIWEFEDREAHQRYIRHPWHGPMDERIRPFFENWTGIRYDFEPERQFEPKGDLS